MKAINLDTYSLSLLTAKEDILNPRSSTNWALFTYDGITNNLKLSDSGAGGVTELAGKFHVKRPLYGLCRVGMDGQGPSRIVMITWVGEGVDEYRRVECASHLPAVKVFFKEAHVFVNTSRPEDVTEEQIRAIISKLSAPKERVQRACLSADKEETVGTNYKRTIAAMEIRRFSRDSFWARAEKEEEDRKEEECRRAVEDRRRRERERIQQERREAEERDRKMNEKQQKIQEQRKIQAKIEAEARRQEKLKWEQEQREHEEEMSARFLHSESIEKAAEAATLVSQRSLNPREFFRQLSSTPSHNPSNSGSPRTVRPPFRRYQRSLTDTAFIFARLLPENSEVTSLKSVSQSEGQEPPFEIPSDPEVRAAVVDTGVIPVAGEEEAGENRAPEEEAELHFQAREPATALVGGESSPAVDSQLSEPVPPALDTTVEETEPAVDSSSPGEEDIESRAVHEGGPPAGVGGENEEEEAEEGTVPSQEPILTGEAEEGVEFEAVCHPYQESGATGEVVVHGDIPQSPPQEPSSLTANGMSTEPRVREENGVSLEPRDTGENLRHSELDDDSEFIPSTKKHDVREEAVTDKHGECLDTDGQLRVRALYDYQAEHESELSLEPGDIISVMETVDKAWWRGCNTDGRQGLFPANYVETI
ncbi:hypothetical protein SKAU_G00360060 [Synaphobranchus kaupii]|uniref:Drebrin n=1 Tax=Synaphobranchus kaupii TaxID=118154 RepID=A0A9Q1EI61_SYNKA|nr:hypothetical protein SKAU_G00360060 [Synaphobranchus kaupii]